MRSSPDPSETSVNVPSPLLAKTSVGSFSSPGEEEVEVAVTVEIGEGGRTVAVVLVGGFGQRHACFGGGILEHQVAKVPIQEIGQAVAAHDGEVDVAVVVVVARRRAARQDVGHFVVPHRLCVADGEVDSRGSRPIHEQGRVGGRRRWGRRWLRLYWRRGRAAAGPAAASRQQHRETSDGECSEVRFAWNNPQPI